VEGIFINIGINGGVMKRTIIIFIIALLLFPFAAVADEDDSEAFDKGRENNPVDEEVPVSYFLDMAGTYGNLEIRYPGHPELEIVSVVILLSRDGSVKNGEEVFFDFRSERADGADILSIFREPEKTGVEFISTLGFTREGADCLSISYIEDGFYKTVYNSDVIDILMDD
jgi:hypothetical protein